MFKEKLLGKGVYEFPGLVSLSSSPSLSHAAASDNKENKVNDEGSDEVVGSDRTRREHGLLGLLDNLTTSHNMLLSCGLDLSNMVNFASTEPLYLSFDPFSDNDIKFSTKETEVYKRHDCTLDREAFKKFHLESLLYTFYSFPKDLYQTLAAQELYRRQWRYHRQLLCWMILKPDTDHNVGRYIFFDINAFTQKVYPVKGVNLPEEGFLSEEEISTPSSGKFQ